MRDCGNAEKDEDLMAISDQPELHDYRMEYTEQSGNTSHFTHG
jgi:hypothetical protein